MTLAPGRQNGEGQYLSPPTQLCSGSVPELCQKRVFMAFGHCPHLLWGVPSVLGYSDCLNPEVWVWLAGVDAAARQRLPHCLPQTLLSPQAPALSFPLCIDWNTYNSLSLVLLFIPFYLNMDSRQAVILAEKEEVLVQSGDFYQGIKSQPGELTRCQGLAEQ